MSEEMYRLAKVILAIVLLVILAIYLYGERYVAFRDGFVINKYNNELYRCKLTE